jgi:EF hand
MKKIALMLGTAAALLAVPALAQGGRERPNPDANGDGIVTRAEVSSSVAARFAKMDANKDGKVDKADREARMAARDGDGREGKGKRRGPARFDANGDGAISLAEMQAAALARFDRVDANKDGQLTETERQAMRGQMGGRKRGGPDGAPPEG